jgi:hypothetical protein
MQDLAIDNPDAFTERRWLTPTVRVQGVLMLVACLVGGRPYRAFMTYAGLEGATMLLLPRQYVEFGNGVGYDGTDPFEWKPRYLPGVRACGALLVVLALRARRQSSSE